jgi:hypothetical protein
MKELSPPFSQIEDCVFHLLSGNCSMLSNHGRLTFTETTASNGGGAKGGRVPATPRASRYEHSVNSGDFKVGRYARLFRRSSEFDPPPDCPRKYGRL